MSIDFIVWCIRILYFCTAFEVLGPKLIMIYKMMKDTFLIFVCFMLVFLFGFSITSWSLLSTNNQLTWLYATNGSFINVTVASEGRQLWNWQLLRDVFNWGIWKIFGQIAEPYKNSATGMDVISENDIYGTVVFFYAIAFVVISNILLLNVLIAMFNDTIGRILTESQILWRYQRFWLVRECSEKTMLPPPLNIIYYLIHFIIYPLWLKIYIICFWNLSDESCKSNIGNNKREINVENNFYQMNVEREYAEKYWKYKIFMKDIQISTEVTLERLETKLTKSNDRQVEDFQQVKNEIRETQDLVNRQLKLQWISQGLRISQMNVIIRSIFTGQWTLFNNNDDMFSFMFTVVIPNIPVNARWSHIGVTVAGGYREGYATNELDHPCGLVIDEDQAVVIADSYNDRVVQWKFGDTNGQVIAGGRDRGNRLDQLNGPVDVLIDKETDSLIISDRENRRVVRWSRRSGTTQGEVLFKNIKCYGLAIDDQRYIYVADTDKHEVRRFRIGNKHGTIVAGGHGKGVQLKQLNAPTYIFVDQEQAVYVSDNNNHRVMKWNKGLIVDTSGTIYVADSNNKRVMCWPKGATLGTIAVDGNGSREGTDQLNNAVGLSFDRHVTLYVVDSLKARVQRFSIE
ncbi:unnamed protein product [Rotaria socialis]|uniref:Uncharacterized protein n=2 Tax=Rotaria socialis TaxID=392032 RepID=A0A821GDJ3_9BILA|nr:unnamed protein product [Rotaria socialis]